MQMHRHTVACYISKMKSIDIHISNNDKYPILGEGIARYF